MHPALGGKGLLVGLLTVSPVLIPALLFGVIVKFAPLQSGRAAWQFCCENTLEVIIIKQTIMILMRIH